MSNELNLMPCITCGQWSAGQTGEYPCQQCGIPTLHDPDTRAKAVLSALFKPCPTCPSRNSCSASRWCDAACTTGVPFSPEGHRGFPVKSVSFSLIPAIQVDATPEGIPVVVNRDQESPDGWLTTEDWVATGEEWRRLRNAGWSIYVSDETHDGTAFKVRLLKEGGMHSSTYHFEGEAWGDTILGAMTAALAESDGT